MHGPRFEFVQHLLEALFASSGDDSQAYALNHLELLREAQAGGRHNATRNPSDSPDAADAGRPDRAPVPTAADEADAQSGGGASGGGCCRPRRQHSVGALELLELRGFGAADAAGAEDLERVAEDLERAAAAARDGREEARRVLEELRQAVEQGIRQLKLARPAANPRLGPCGAHS